MSYGFIIYDSAGVELISSSRYGITLIDRFQVASGSTGEKSYPHYEDMTFQVVQTQQEPATVTHNALKSFNAVTITISEVVGVKKVAWSPKYTIGTAYPIDIYVLGI